MNLVWAAYHVVVSSVRSVRSTFRSQRALQVMSTMACPMVGMLPHRRHAACNSKGKGETNAGNVVDILVY